jgi:hypothetical protein
MALSFVVVVGFERLANHMKARDRAATGASKRFPYEAWLVVGLVFQAFALYLAPRLMAYLIQKPPFTL